MPSIALTVSKLILRDDDEKKENDHTNKFDQQNMWILIVSGVAMLIIFAVLIWRHNLKRSHRRKQGMSTPPPAKWVYFDSWSGLEMRTIRSRSSNHFKDLSTTYQDDESWSHAIEQPSSLEDERLDCLSDRITTANAIKPICFAFSMLMKDPRHWEKSAKNMAFQTHIHWFLHLSPDLNLEHQDALTFPWWWVWAVGLESFTVVSCSYQQIIFRLMDVGKFVLFRIFSNCPVHSLLTMSSIWILNTKSNLPRVQVLGYVAEALFPWQNPAHIYSIPTRRDHDFGDSARTHDVALPQIVIQIMYWSSIQLEFRMNWDICLFPEIDLRKQGSSLRLLLLELVKVEIPLPSDWW